MKEQNLDILNKRSERLSKIIEERQELLGEIGTGSIALGSSFDNTIRIGRVRKRVASSVDRFSNEFLAVRSELQERRKTEAKNFLAELKLSEAKLDQIRELAREGYVEKEYLEFHEEEFKELKKRPQREPWLMDAIRKLAEKKKEKTESKEKTMISQPPKTETRSGRFGPRPKLFDLKNGEKVAGKAGLLLKIVQEHSVGEILTFEEAVVAIYGRDNEKSRGNLHALIGYVRRVTKDEDFEVIVEPGQGIVFKKKIISLAIEPAPIPKLQILDFIDTPNLPAIRTDVSITIEFVDGLLTWKPKGLQSYERLGAEVEALQTLVLSFQRGENTIPRATDFLGHLTIEDKQKLALRTLQGMLATTIVGEIQKIGEQGLKAKLGVQVNQLMYFLGTVQAREIIVKAMESLPDLQRMILFRALSTNMKEKLDFPDIEECDEETFAVYIIHTTWPQLRRTGFDKILQEPIDEVIKPAQVNDLEKLLQTAFERARDGDLDVSKIIDFIQKRTKFGNYLFNTILKIAEIGGFLEPAYYFFQENTSTRGYAMRINRILNEDRMPAEEE